MSDTEHRVRTAADAVRVGLLGLLDHDGVTDLAFIGTASDRYEWRPSRIVDFDAFVFCERRGPAVGGLLDELRRRLAAALDDLGVDLELRVLRGAYKPDRHDDDRPIVLAHLGVFGEADYLDEPVTKRWAWRKYPCIREPGRLARLCPARPTRDDVLDGPRGIREKLRDLRAGATVMEEWVLPDLALVERVFRDGDAAFTEFCHGAVATGARHHARLLGYPEPDVLGNDDFFPWYDRSVLATESLLPLVDRKRRSRNEGFGALGAGSRPLAIDFLEAVARALRST